MLTVEADELTKKLAELFPRAKFEAVELDSWCDIFRRQAYEPAKAALTTLWEQTKYNRPQPSHFLAILIGNGPKKAKHERLDPTTDVFIQCIEAPKHAPQKIGQWFPVHTYPLHDWDRGKRVEAAEAMAAEYHDSVGGTWIVVQQASVFEMQGASARLKGDERLIALHDKLSADLAAQTNAPA